MTEAEMHCDVGSSVVERHDPLSSKPKHGCPEKEIFLVDDNPGVRSALARSLGQAGFVVRCFGSAQECLNEIPKRPCDLVITDVHMPGMNGMALLRQVRRCLPSLPVLVMSADNDPQMRAQAADNGPVAFLEKPICGDRLLDVVERALGRHRDR